MCSTADGMHQLRHGGFAHRVYPQSCITKSKILFKRLVKIMVCKATLEQAAACARGGQERLLLVAVFMVSGCANYDDHADLKSLNPLAGETYELVVPEKGAWLLGEAVQATRLPPLPSG